MQIEFNFYSAAPEDTEPFFASGKDVREGLEQYIKKCGLVKYKDYYMDLKLGKNNNIPANIEKQHFLEMAKDVYQKYTASLEKKAIKKAA
jgi:hypothetical protein